MSEQIEVLIVGSSSDSMILARVREELIASGRKIVNVGTIGHIDHGRETPERIAELLGAHITLEPQHTLRDLIPALTTRDKVRRGKGKSRLDKQNRWK